MQIETNRIYCIHALDESTSFLTEFKNIKFVEYIELNANDDSIRNILGRINSFERQSIVIFLGHGHSSGLYSPETTDFGKRIYLNSELANGLFNDQSILLLSCKSADFIRHLSTYRNIIGFGNILSSLAEVTHEANYTGHFRNLAQEDIDYFNTSYVKSITNSIKLLAERHITFRMVPQYIAYFINKEINNVLRRKYKSNRVALATLLFEFRNEMVYRKNLNT